MVVAARGTSRDHRARLSPLGLIVMLLEGFVRSLGAPRHLLGNHVLLRADADSIRVAAGADGSTGGPADGSAGGPAKGSAGVSSPDDTVIAVLAHLRHGSLQVAPGERVAAGQQLAECGNSGNSSDPHVHFQLMDGPDITTAHGLPFQWEYLSEDGEPQRGVPANEELFVVEGQELGRRPR